MEVVSLQISMFNMDVDVAHRHDVEVNVEVDVDVNVDVAVALQTSFDLAKNGTTPRCQKERAKCDTYDGGSVRGLNRARETVFGVTYG